MSSKDDIAVCKGAVGTKAVQADTLTIRGMTGFGHGVENAGDNALLDGGAYGAARATLECHYADKLQISFVSCLGDLRDLHSKL